MLEVRAMSDDHGLLQCVLFDLNVRHGRLARNRLYRRRGAYRCGALREDRCGAHCDRDQRGCDFLKHDNLLTFRASALLPRRVFPGRPLAPIMVAYCTDGSERGLRCVVTQRSSRKRRMAERL
jgi:hypothetical protein